LPFKFILPAQASFFYFQEEKREREREREKRRRKGGKENAKRTTDDEWLLRARLVSVSIYQGERGGRLQVVALRRW
jgi:hypothetical protein